jgi:quinol monooxygenase YgiN
MITVLFYCTGKPGTDESLRALLGEMQRISRTEDRAISYTFMQQADNPSEWALFEQWRSRDHLEAHVANMKKHFGEPPPGARLPARLAALVQSHSHKFYHPVE